MKKKYILICSIFCFILVLLMPVIPSIELSEVKDVRENLLEIDREYIINLFSEFKNKDNNCDCDNEQLSSCDFPIICFILNLIMIIPLILFGFGSFLGSLALWFRLIGLIGNVIINISIPIIYALIDVGTIFDCNWWFISP